MPRPVMGRRDGTRVEFRLSPPLAERVYTYAKAEGLTLSQSGERLLEFALVELSGEAGPTRRSRISNGDHIAEGA